MAANRIETLKSMVEQDPGNAFTRYGLAMEYVNTGAPEQAIEQFHALLAAHPDYGAGYYHAGRAFEKLGRVNEARSMYQRGIESTGRSGDRYTQSELQAALDELG